LIEDLSSGPEDLYFFQPELLIMHQPVNSSPGIWNWHDATAEVLQAQQEVLSNQYFAFMQSRRIYSHHFCLHGFSLLFWKQQQQFMILHFLPLENRRGFSGWDPLTKPLLQDTAQRIH